MRSGLRLQKFVLLPFWRLESEIKMLTGWVSSGGFERKPGPCLCSWLLVIASNPCHSLAYRCITPVPVFVILWWSLFCASVSKYLSSYKDPFSSSNISSWLFLQKVFSKYIHFHRFQGLEFQHMFFWEVQFNPQQTHYWIACTRNSFSVLNNSC